MAEVRINLEAEQLKTWSQRIADVHTRIALARLSMAEIKTIDSPDVRIDKLETLVTRLAADQELFAALLRDILSSIQPL